MASSGGLGGSSKFSNENLENRSGERFYVNHTWVIRSNHKYPIMGHLSNENQVNIPELKHRYLGLLVHVCSNTTELGDVGKNTRRSSCSL